MQRSNIAGPIDLLCGVTGRRIECFCLDCMRLECPTCLMFGACKGHEVCPIDDASNQIRGDIDKALKDGLFKANRTNSILLDIRHTKLQCEETKEKLSKQIQATFQNLIAVLKQREEELLKELDNTFNTEICHIQSEEDLWVSKENAIVNLLGKMDLHSSGEDNVNLLKDAHEIYGYLKLLREPVLFKLSEFPQSLDTNLYFRKEKLNLEMNASELEILLRKFAKIQEYVKTQYKS